MINDPTLTSDKSLLQMYARNQDPQAFSEITRRYAGLVYGTCKRVLGSDDDAQDVSQECFLELARKAGQVRSSLPAYLHHLARNRSIDLIRKASTRRNLEKEALLNSASPDPKWAEIAPLIDEAIASLPKRYRVPIIMHYLQGHTQAEVASMLGTSQSTTSRDLDRGIVMLRDHLKASGVLVTSAVLAGLLSGNASAAAPAALNASLGKIAVSGITGPVKGGVGLIAAPIVGTLAGKLIVGVVGLAVVGMVASSAISGLHAENDPTNIPPFEGVTRVTGTEATKLGDKARGESTKAAYRITSGKGVVRVLTTSKTDAGGEYTQERTYKIAFSGLKYACELQDYIHPPAGYKPGPGEKSGVKLIRIWSDGMHCTAYELGGTQVNTGTFTDPVNGFGPVPWEDEAIREDVSIWSHSQAMIGSPYTRTASGYTTTVEQTGAGRETVNGDECVAIESTMTVTPGKSGKAIIINWVDTQKGWALTRQRIYAQRTEDSKLYLSSETDIDLKDYGKGLWAPSRIAKATYTLNSTGEPELHGTRVATYDPSFRVNIPVTKRDLTFSIPNGLDAVEMK